MKALLLTVSVFFLISCGQSGNQNSGKGDNSSTSDEQVKIISQSIPLADPFILLYDGVYYAYGTSSGDGFEVYYSENLEGWKKHPELLLDKKDSYADRWFWAPEVYYNEADSKFYLYYSADEHICVAHSDSPLGPFVQEEKQAMLEEKGIDSSLFIDDDGTPYLYFVRFTDGNVIWVAGLEEDRVTLKQETLRKCFEVSQEWEMAMGRVVEGPSVVKKNDIYYLIYSGNDFRSPEYGVGYATAASPWGPWEKSPSNPILQRPYNGLSGVGHGALFFDKEGKSKYVFHAHSNDSVVHPRDMYITGMTITGDNQIVVDEHVIRPYEIE